jgi:methionine-rich copper-binding protein CopC
MVTLAEGLTMKKLFLALLSIALFSITSAYAADTRLAKSTPADGSTLSSPPSAFVFDFSKPVRFHDLSIRKDDGKSRHSIGNLPTAHAATLTVPAPSLSPGQYVLEWQVFTDESTALSGRVRFTVSAEGVAALASPH